MWFGHDLSTLVVALTCLMTSTVLDAITRSSSYQERLIFALPGVVYQTLELLVLRLHSLLSTYRGYNTCNNVVRVIAVNEFPVATSIIIAVLLGVVVIKFSMY